MKEQKERQKSLTLCRCNEGDQVRILDCDVADLVSEQDKCSMPVPDEVFSEVEGNRAKNAVSKI